MESGSQADTPAERTSQKFANVIGTFIALLTLAIPIVSIAYFSSSETWQPPAYLMPRSREARN